MLWLQIMSIFFLQCRLLYLTWLYVMVTKPLFFIGLMPLVTYNKIRYHDLTRHLYLHSGRLFNVQSLWCQNQRKKYCPVFFLCCEDLKLIFDVCELTLHLNSLVLSKRSLIKLNKQVTIYVIQAFHNATKPPHAQA